MKSHTKNAVKVFIIAIVIPLAVGGASALLTGGNMDVYTELKSPPLSPPSILFPIVWTVLYTLMGISSALVWLNRDKDPSAAESGLAYYVISLAFNFAWSIFFFNLRLFFFSFLWLLVLLYLIIRTVLFYRRISPISAYLQIPYILWVSFAGYLNLGIWLLNR